MTREGSPVDGLRLALGTLTAVRVPPPRLVDAGTGSWAMTFAPLVGALLAVPAGALLWLLGLTGTPPLLDAVLVVGLLALLTRAIHLDGLADTADGLGSGRPAEGALEVMRRSDIGPFGTLTLVLVLLLQVVALASLVASGGGILAVGLALVLSRLVLPLLCLRGTAAARPDGLGRVVAGTVRPGQLALAATAAVVLVAGPLLLTVTDPRVVVLALVGSPLAVAAGFLHGRRVVRRLGGITGDVLGAAVEVTFTTTLVLLTLLA